MTKWIKNHLKIEKFHNKSHSYNAQNTVKFVFCNKLLEKSQKLKHAC